MATALIDDRSLELVWQLFHCSDQRFYRPISPLGPFDRCVKVVDVGLVVLAVVDLHGLGVDVRFQRIVGVRQCRQGVRHFQWIP